jgi:hypothetical protein
VHSGRSLAREQGSAVARGNPQRCAYCASQTKAKRLNILLLLQVTNSVNQIRTPVLIAISADWENAIRY